MTGPTRRVPQPVHDAWWAAVEKLTMFQALNCDGCGIDPERTADGCNKCAPLLAVVRRIEARLHLDEALPEGLGYTPGPRGWIPEDPFIEED